MAVVTIKQVKLQTQVKVVQEETVQNFQHIQVIIMPAVVAEVQFKMVQETVDQEVKAAEAEVAEETLVLQECKPDLQTQAVAQVVADKLDQVQTVVQV